MTPEGRRILASLALAVFVLAFNNQVSARGEDAPTTSAFNMRSVARVLPPIGDQVVPEGPGDMAFYGDLAVVGRGFNSADPRDSGFSLFDISDPSSPRWLSGFQCTQSGFDVSIYEDIVIVSRDQPSASADCGSDDVPAGTPGAFAGLHVFSVTDPSRPVPEAAVRTNLCPAQQDEAPSVDESGCSYGSHTHTVIPDTANRRLIVYANNPNLTIVKVPLDNPADSEVVEVVDPPFGPHGCHDVQVLMSAKLAACMSIHYGSLWDITDPLAPQPITHIRDPEIHHHHSAVFSSDGSTMVVSDESVLVGGTAITVDRIGRFAGQTRFLADSIDTCQGEVDGQEVPTGRLHFYDIEATIRDYREGKVPRPPHKVDTFQVPAQVAAMTNGMCYGHYASVVPVRERPGLTVKNLLAVAWGAAGTWLIDFTDPSNVREVAHFVTTEANDGSAGSEPASFPYASYWYNGFVYANNGSAPNYPSRRGFEVLRVTGSADLAVRAALNAANDSPFLLPQTQP